MSVKFNISFLRNLLFEKIIRQEMAFFDKNTPGELNTRITGNINQIQLAIGSKFADTMMMIGRGIGCFILAMKTSWKFSLVFTGLTPFVGLFVSLVVVFVKKYTILEFKAYGKAGAIAQEVLSSLRTVISLGIQKKKLEDYKEKLKIADKVSIKKGLIQGVLSGLSQFFCFWQPLVLVSTMEHI